MYNPPYSIQFRACVKEGRTYNRLIDLLDSYSDVSPVIKGNCVYFDSPMYENEFGNLLYELFDVRNPTMRLAQDFDSVYIFMDGDLYTYYDRWKVIGHRIIPTSDDVSPILDEIRDVTKEFNLRRERYYLPFVL